MIIYYLLSGSRLSQRSSSTSSRWVGSGGRERGTVVLLSQEAEKVEEGEGEAGEANILGVSE